MSSYNYNFDEALKNFKDKKDLGMDEDNWDDFSNQVRNLFNGKDIPETNQPESDDDKKVNKLFNKYIQNRIANSDIGSPELVKKYPALTGDEIIYLNKMTADTWEQSADLQLQLTFTHQSQIRNKVEKAQKEIYDLWKNESKIVSKDSQLYKDASIDSNFPNIYLLNLQKDAQNQVMDAYYKDQTRVEQMNPSIIKMAYQDPHFEQSIHEFYKSMDNTASKMGVSVPQLIQLQTTPEEKQDALFKKISLENLSKSQQDVETAQQIISNQAKAKQAGVYDIDELLLETDPTLIGVWKPTDSQILQAHSAGMTLQEYLDFMNNLSQGKVTDLPEYSKDHIRHTGDLDFKHFQQELELGGYNRDMYNYNPDTLEITMNPNYNELPVNTNVEKIVARYAPRKLQQERHEYLEHIHGMNQNMQEQLHKFYLCF